MVAKKVMNEVISLADIESIYRKAGVNPNLPVEKIRTTVNTGTMSNRLATQIPNGRFSTHQPSYTIAQDNRAFSQF